MAEQGGAQIEHTPEVSTPEVSSTQSQPEQAQPSNPQQEPETPDTRLQDQSSPQGHGNTSEGAANPYQVTQFCGFRYFYVESIVVLLEILLYSSHLSEPWYDDLCVQ